MIAISVVLAGAILAIALWVLAQMHADALRRAQDAVLNVSLLIERDLSRNLETYDLSLRATIGGLQEPGALALKPSLRQMVLFDGSVGAKDLGSVYVLDEHGKVRFASRASPPRGLDLSARDYFKVQRDAPDAGLYISHPFMPKTGDQHLTIALSRRISRPDGSFGGVVVGTMRLQYFRSLFDGMSLGAGGSMALVLTDGTLLMRGPYDPAVIGISLASTSNYQRFMQKPSGEFFGKAAIDGVERWYVYRHIGTYPLILDVAMSKRDIYEQWRHRAWIIGSLIAALDATIIALAILFAQQLRRRLDAERELNALARTDGLTGLNNRRAFEEALQQTARRAQRSGQPWSLLLIDVDSFKGFNDLYGHAAGDDALIDVARSIARNVRRPGDMAARYGGEEFAALLPDTDAAGARQIAEQIRSAVESLRRVHLASSHRRLTVSIGIASANGGVPTPGRVLIEAADEALYEAKDAGRNRVRMHRERASEAAGMSMSASMSMDDSNAASDEHELRSPR